MVIYVNIFFHVHVANVTMHFSVNLIVLCLNLPINLVNKTEHFIALSTNQEPEVGTDILN